MMPIAHLVESDKNPRKHFDPKKLEELKASIKEHGVLTPMLARPIPVAKEMGGIAYELAAGHRRFRASKMAGLLDVPVLVREMDDVQFLEVLTIENLQRDDVHPLEEGKGYQDLMLQASYTAERIAERVGKSVKYVYDRIKLLALVPKAQELFLAGKMSPGHAILLARLKPEDQKRAIDPEDITALFTIDHCLWTGDAKDERGSYEHLKTCSVREFERWIDENVRLDPSRDKDALVFPSIAEHVVSAAQKKLDVVAITENHQLRPEVKDPTGKRTYGPTMWKRADGKQKSKPCDSAVMGFIAVGEGRGTAFMVCIDKKNCRVHWGAEIREREGREKKSSATVDKYNTAAAGAAAAKQPKKSSWEIENEKRAAKRREWEQTVDAVIEATAERVQKLSISALLGIINDQMPNDSAASKLVPPGKTADSVLRHLAFAVLFDNAGMYDAYESFPKWAKEIGLDLKKIIAGAKPEVEAKSAAKTAKKRR